MSEDVIDPNILKQIGAAAAVVTDARGEAMLERLDTFKSAARAAEERVFRLMEGPFAEDAMVGDVTLAVGDALTQDELVALGRNYVDLVSRDQYIDAGNFPVIIALDYGGGSTVFVEGGMVSLCEHHDEVVYDAVTELLEDIEHGEH